MKQVSYEFDMQDLMFCLMRDRTDVEDGHWQLQFMTESLSASFPQLTSDQRPEVLPGHIVRLTGVIMAKVPVPSSMSVEIRDGLVVIPRKDKLPIQGELFDGIDRNQNGSEQSSESSGENR